MSSSKNSVDEESWSSVLTPERGWFDLRLKEVWTYRDLIFGFFRRDFVSGYKQTILGPFWFVIPPLATTLVFTVIFGQIGQISTNGMPAFLFFNLGVIAWNYFQNCLSRTAATFSGNAGIFSKVYFPRLIMPISSMISNLLSFGIQFALFLIIYLFYWFRGSDVTPGWSLLMIPFLLIQMAALGLGCGCIVSALTTRYRDLAMVVSFGTQLWMYASCVVFPLSQIPPEWRIYFLINPMVPITESFRKAFGGESIVEPWHLGLSALISVGLLIYGLLMFNRAEKTFADTI